MKASCILFPPYAPYTGGSFSLVQVYSTNHNFKSINEIDFGYGNILDFSLFLSTFKTNTYS